MKIDFNEDTLFCAFRYALGRRSYITHNIADQLIKNWHLLHKNTQEQIVNEIAKAIENNRAGDNIDEQIWLQVIFNHQLEVKNETL
jgi:hypothetical protein